MAMLDRVPDVVFKTRVRDESIEGPNPFHWQGIYSSILDPDDRP